MVTTPSCSGAGNTVDAGGGSNIISNGTGNDTFILPGAGLGFDVIADFTKTNDDVVNLHGALQDTTWNGKANTLSNYVKVTDVGSNTYIAVAHNGTGSGVQVAQLTNTPGLSFNDLISHHSIQA